ncbi:MAG: phosphoribosylformylglycinamidine cyclo-ligase [Tissierellia bacterium]|nr:phosphoribosylformylglycinamidine cyclo-ligase [Tissierellia bacterium]
MGLTYKDSGVDKTAGYEEVKLIKNFVKDTYIDGVISDIGGFAGLFELNKDAYDKPVLVSGTDGVGSKVQIAQMMDVHDSIGEDCVAMCVNDVLCQGAKPIFFLDYIATGKLVPEKMADIVKGVSSGCIKAGCALIGGETAEMPGIYKENDYDLAGFSVAIVDKDKIITGEKVQFGDVILGLPSSGIHSNGYSLVRKIVFDRMKFDLGVYVDELESTLGEELLIPTRIYVDTVYPLIEKYDIHGISHITGGGIYENLPRVLKDGYRAKIDYSKVEIPTIFKLLQTWGGIQTEEMFGTFNMGIGMVLVVNKEDSEKIIEEFNAKGEVIYQLGEIIEGETGVELCLE